MIVTLLAMTSEKQTPKVVCIQFTDNWAGWDYMGLIVMDGQVAYMFVVLGPSSGAFSSTCS